MKSRYWSLYETWLLTLILAWVACHAGAAFGQAPTQRKSDRPKPLQYTLAAVDDRPAPKPEPRKDCGCSTSCTCGCQDGGPCSCGNTGTPPKVTSRLIADTIAQVDQLRQEVDATLARHRAVPSYDTLKPKRKVRSRRCCEDEDREEAVIQPAPKPVYVPAPVMVPHTYGQRGYVVPQPQGGTYWPASPGYQTYYQPAYQPAGRFFGGRRGGGSC